MNQFYRLKSKHKFSFLILICLMAFALLGSVITFASDIDDQYKLKLTLETQKKIENYQTQRIIVLFDDSKLQQKSPQGHLSGNLDIKAISELKNQVFSRMNHLNMSTILDYESLPLASVEIKSPEALKELIQNPDIVQVFSDEKRYLNLAQSLPLINQPAVAALGHTGAGTTVAVLDTGTDFTRAAFGSCTNAGDPGCQVVYAQDFAPSDNNVDDNGHGTNVAGIVVGVAPNTNIAALDVFTGGTAWDSDIIAALNWSITNQAHYNIVAANMSLGGGKFYSECSGNVYEPVFTSLRSAGIVPVLASGNNGWSNAMAAPACTPGAVRVGAVYDSNVGSYSSGGASCTDSTTAADQVTCFSNSDDFLTLLAPGTWISAAGITMSGTSQAAPHVAGAIAILQGARPGDSINTSIRRLELSGVPVTDSRNSIVKPRIDLSGAVSVTNCQLNPSSCLVFDICDIYPELCRPPVDICDLNPYAPGCFDICELNPRAPGCGLVIDICDLNPSAPGCIDLCDPRYCDPSPIDHVINPIDHVIDPIIDPVFRDKLIAPDDSFLPNPRF